VWFQNDISFLGLSFMKSDALLLASHMIRLTSVEHILITKIIHLGSEWLQLEVKMEVFSACICSFFGKATWKFYHSSNPSTCPLGGNFHLAQRRPSNHCEPYHFITSSRTKISPPGSTKHKLSWKFCLKTHKNIGTGNLYKLQNDSKSQHTYILLQWLLSKAQTIWNCEDTMLVVIHWMTIISFCCPIHVIIHNLSSQILGENEMLGDWVLLDLQNMPTSECVRMQKMIGDVTSLFILANIQNQAIHTMENGSCLLFCRCFWAVLKQKHHVHFYKCFIKPNTHKDSTPITAALVKRSDSNACQVQKFEIQCISWSFVMMIQALKNITENMSFPALCKLCGALQLFWKQTLG